MQTGLPKPKTRRAGRWAWLVLLITAAPSLQGQAPTPASVVPIVRARAAFLLNASTGKTLYARNAETPLPPASLTKIVTGALLAAEVPPDTPITASARAAHTPGDTIHLRPGETLTADALLYALLLVSANDAAQSAADHLAPTTGAFADRMNAWSQANGATHTHWVNPSGLPAPGHAATAHDLALLARAALDIPRFARAVATRQYRLHRPASPDAELVNKNHLLGIVPGMDGVKTGCTQEAGYCFVGSATRGGTRLIAVVLHSPDWQAETRALLEYGFAHPGADIEAGATPSPDVTMPPRTGPGSPAGTGLASGRAGRVGDGAEPAKQAAPLPTTPPAAQRSPKLPPEAAPLAANASQAGAQDTTPSVLAAIRSQLARTPFSNARQERPGNSNKPSANRTLFPVKTSKRRGYDAPTSPASPGGGAVGWNVRLALLTLGALLMAWFWNWNRKRDGNMVRFALPHLKPKHKTPPPPSAPAVDVEENEDTPACWTWNAPDLTRHTAEQWLTALRDLPVRLLDAPTRRQARALVTASPRKADAGWQELLNGANLKLRIAGADVLTPQSPRRAEATLLALLQNEKAGSELRGEAVGLLAALGGDRLEPLWLKMLIEEGSLPAARALAEQPGLEAASVTALTAALHPSSSEPLHSDALLKRRLRDAQIASVLAAHEHLEESAVQTHLSALPAHHQENVVIGVLRGVRTPRCVGRVVNTFLQGQQPHTALQALTEGVPEQVREALQAQTTDLEAGTARQRAEIAAWLVLGEGDDRAIRKRAEAGSETAQAALHLAHTTRWNPYTAAPDALLAAAQIVSLRLGFTAYTPEQVAAALRRSHGDAINEADTLPPGLHALAEANTRDDVSTAVQVAWHTPQGLDTLLLALTRHTHSPQIQRELTFWADKVSTPVRLAIAASLVSHNTPAGLQVRQHSVGDPDAHVRNLGRCAFHTRPDAQNVVPPEQNTAHGPNASSDAAPTVEDAPEQLAA